MTFTPHFDTPGVILRFAAGPRLRMWLDTPDARHLFRVDLALVENEIWHVYGAIDRLPGWTWQAAITPRNIPPTRWHQQISIAASSDLACGITIALTDLGALLHQPGSPITSIGTDRVHAAFVDATPAHTQTIDATHTTTLLLHTAQTVRAGQTLMIACDWTIMPS